MRASFTCSLAALLLLAMPFAYAQDSGLTVPATVQAGQAFSISAQGSGTAVVYIVGPGQALKKTVQIGQNVEFPAGSLYNAGHYAVVLVEGSSVQNGYLKVVPAKQAAKLSFLAKPSRLPVGINNGISGAVYVFDAYNNLIVAPMPVSFKLSNPSGNVQQRTVNTSDGAAWTLMNSTPKEGIDKFVAHTDGISSTRVIQQVPGDPCGLKMTATRAGANIQLKTDPVRDCSGNAVPDGTIATFTETFNGKQTTVDVPLKHDVAQVEMPAHPGATITVASGVVLGNEIHWPK